MLKLFSNLPNEQMFFDYVSEKQWIKVNASSAIFIDDDDDYEKFGFCEKVKIDPSVVCSVEPGFMADFEFKRRVNSDSHVDMALAEKEGRLFARELFGEPARGGFDYVVIAPHAIPKFRQWTVLDGWEVDVTGRKAPQFMPAAAPILKRELSDFYFVPEAKKLFDAFYGVVTPESNLGILKAASKLLAVAITGEQTLVQRHARSTEPTP